MANLHFTSLFFNKPTEDLPIMIRNSMNSQYFQILRNREFVQKQYEPESEHKSNLTLINNNASYNTLASILQSYVKSIQHPIHSIHDELRERRKYMLIGLSMCIKDPIQAASHQIPTIITKHIFWPITERLNAIVKMSGSHDDKLVKEIISFQNDTMTSFFTSVLFFYDAIFRNNTKGREGRYVSYFFGFFLSLIGDIIEHSSVDKNYDFINQFHLMATNLSPKYSRPFHILGAFYSKNGQYFKSLVYYSRFLLSTPDSSGYQFATVNLVSLCESISNKYQHHELILISNGGTIERKLKSRKHHLMVFKTPTGYKCVHLLNNNKPHILPGYCRSYYAFNNIHKISLKTTVDAVYEKFVWTFLLLTSRIIVRKQEETMDQLFNELQLSFTFIMTTATRSTLFHHNCLMFAFIIIYCVQISLFDRYEFVDEQNKYLEMSISLICTFSNKFFVLLTERNDNMPQRYNYFKFFALILRCLEVSCKNIYFKVAIQASFTTIDCSFIPLLHEYLQTCTSEVVQVDTDILPILKSLSYSPFTIPEDSSYWDKLTAAVDSIDEKAYISSFRSSINNIMASSVFFFAIYTNVCRFDQDAFARYQTNQNIPLKFQDFVDVLPPCEDFELLLFLYNLVVNVNKDKPFCFTFCQYIVPDTNCFIVNMNSVFNCDIFKQLHFAIPSFVMQELERLKTNKKVAERAEESYQLLQTASVKLPNIFPLDNEANFTRRFGVTPRVRYPHENIDNLILSALVKLRNRTRTYYVKNGIEFLARGIIFVTNDKVFGIKVGASHITCINSKILRQISELLQ